MLNKDNKVIANPNIIYMNFYNIVSDFTQIGQAASTASGTTPQILNCNVLVYLTVGDKIVMVTSAVSLAGVWTVKGSATNPSFTAMSIVKIA